jgi:hypothetical protein
MSSRRLAGALVVCFALGCLCCSVGCSNKGKSKVRQEWRQGKRVLRSIVRKLSERSGIDPSYEIRAELSYDGGRTFRPIGRVSGVENPKCKAHALPDESLERNEFEPAFRRPAPVGACVATSSIDFPSLPVS